MADSYTTNTRALKPDTGSRSGTWGSAANTNIFDVLDQALGQATITLTGTSQTITVSDGVASDAGAMAVVFDGTPGGTTTVTIAPATLQKVWIFQNSTTDGSQVDISQGSGANVEIPNGYSAIVYSDGGGASAAVYNVLDSVSFTNIQGSVQTATGHAITHDGLTGFVANEHINHTSVSISGGVGISGGGDISANRSLALDVDGLTSAPGSIQPSSDTVPIYDASEMGVRKVTITDLVASAAASGVSSVTAGEGLANDGTAADPDLSIALEEIGTDTILAADFMVVVSGAGVHRKQALTNTPVSLFSDDGTYLTTAVESFDLTLGDGIGGSITGTGVGPYTGTVAVTLNVDFSEYAISATPATNDYFLMVDTDASDTGIRVAYGSIPLSRFNDDLTYGGFTQHTESTLAFFSGTPVSQQSTPASLSLLTVSGTGDDVSINANQNDIQTAVNAIISVLASYDLTV